MNRNEALHILGLGEDATAADIKTAYRETVQILHPDRFAGNKKLQDRATEQFKRLQEAYEYLTESKGSKAGRAGGSAKTSSRRTTSEIEGRLAGIAAARTQLIAQRDMLLDERRNGIAFAAVGGIIALICGRRPFGLFGVLAALAGTAAIWGIIQIVSVQRSLSTIEEHLKALQKQKKQLLRKLEEEEA